MGSTMAQPPPYDRSYNFHDYQAENPLKPLPADKLDEEFSRVKTTIDAVLQNLKLIQRDDTALANKSVGFDQLKDEVQLGFNAPTEWEPEKNYIVRDTVFYDTRFYRCLESHVSSSDFEADLNAGLWAMVADFTIVQTTAIAARDAALQAQADAEDARDDASLAKSGAESARDAAIGAKNDAVAAKTASESARDAAVVAKGLAEAARDDAISARNAAQSAQTDAENAADRAEAAAASIDLPTITGNADRMLVAKPDASGYEFETLNYVRGSHVLTPYDRALTNRVDPLDPMNADVGVALNELFSTVAADYYSPLGAFRSRIDLASRPWLSSQSINFTNLRQTGCVVQNGWIYSKAVGRPALDMQNTQGVTFLNGGIWCDKSARPKVGMFIARGKAGGPCGNHRFYGWRLDGFADASIVLYGSEITDLSGLQITNRSKVGNRPCLMITGHSAYISKYIGTINSDYIASENQLSGPTSQLSVNLGFLNINRQSPWGALGIANITKSSPAVVTLSAPPVTNSIALEPPESGDRAFFTVLEGMTEINAKTAVVKKIDATTYELYTDAAMTEPFDTSGYSSYTEGGLMWGATGPGMIFAGGASDVVSTGGYISTYGPSGDAIIFDSQYTQSSFVGHHHRFQHENRPIRSVTYVTPEDGNVNVTEHSIKLLAYNQSPSISPFFVHRVGTGTITFGNDCVFAVDGMSNDGVKSVPSQNWWGAVGRSATRHRGSTVYLPYTEAWFGPTGWAANFIGSVHLGDTGRNIRYGPERTWSPVLKFGGASTGITYDESSGWVEDAGEWQIAHFRIKLSSKGSATGAATIDGLPDTVASGRVGSVSFTGYANMASLGTLMGVVPGGGTSISLKNGGVSDTDNLTDSNFTNTSIIEGSVIYKLT